MFKSNNKIHIVAKLNLSKARLYRCGDRLFALSPQMCHLYDITDKLNPILLSTFNLMSDANGNLNTFLGLNNNRGYFSIGYDAIQVIDFSDESKPASICILKEILIGGRWEFLSDNYLITNIKKPVIYQVNLPLNMGIVYEFKHEISDLVLLDNHLICATLDDGIKTYDLSQPSNPYLVSSLPLNVVRLAAKDSKNILAEGIDGNVYIIDVTDAANIAITTIIKIPGPIASNSLLCKDDHLFVRFMRKTVGDTTQVFNLTNIIKPQNIFEFKSPNMPQYTANNKLLVFMGIKDWDGVSPITNYSTSQYRIFSIGTDIIRHIDDIEIEGIWFSSITLSDNAVYIARPNDILVYSVEL